jgi:hypothetical protein
MVEPSFVSTPVHARPVSKKRATKQEAGRAYPKLIDDIYFVHYWFLSSVVKVRSWILPPKPTLARLRFIPTARRLAMGTEGRLVTFEARHHYAHEVTTSRTYD